MDAAWAQVENEEQRYQEQLAQAAHNTWFDHYYPEDRAMKTSQMIQSKFLKKDDFPTPQRLTIRGVAIEEVGRGDTRWVLFFNEKAKGVVLNVTKIKQLEARFGDESDRWVGKKIQIEHDPTVMMGQQVVGGIKFVMPPMPQQVVQPKAQPVVAAMEREPGADDGFGDEPSDIRAEEW